MRRLYRGANINGCVNLFPPKCDREHVEVTFHKKLLEASQTENKHGGFFFRTTYFAERQS